METLCIIPARGGSKGLPRKNIKPLAGKPLVCWSIDAALSSKTIDRVVVSTEDAEIAQISAGAGAEVIERPAHLATDDALIEDTFIQILDFLEENENYKPDIIVFLQCTSPLTTPEDIDSAVEIRIRENADTVFSAVEGHPFLWCKDEKRQTMEAVNHEQLERKRRQDLPSFYSENGAIYVLGAENIRKTKIRHYGKLAVYPQPAERSIDIDTQHDFDLAHALLSLTSKP